MRPCRLLHSCCSRAPAAYHNGPTHTRLTVQPYPPPAHFTTMTYLTLDSVKSLSVKVTPGAMSTLLSIKLKSMTGQSCRRKNKFGQ
jgi:hypothetical protein